ncbi:hypothetical protein CUJ83_00970 [Methanocella sp. CWC-04]|uniref:Membrane-associated protein n=1 Tax=Methanooceanicella nereidis TaxID=2052831 RepID=A0AAP2R9U6_9EURY|nr:bacteriophage holin [Methanocella sp. CWC-04]MCD1293568.1 hypothetical protein [Methanocella sp. CWC-04]
MVKEIKPVQFGLALGIIWGFGVLMLGLMATFLGWGVQAVSTIGSVYLGYELSVIGSIIGLIWAIVDGFIAGFLIAYIYNVLTKSMA